MIVDEDPLAHSRGKAARRKSSNIMRDASSKAPETSRIALDEFAVIRFSLCETSQAITQKSDFRRRAGRKTSRLVVNRKSLPA